MGSIRRGDIPHYVTEWAGEVSPGSVVKELNVFKHILGLAVDWAMVPIEPAMTVKAPSVPAGRLTLFGEMFLLPAEKEDLNEPESPGLFLSFFRVG